MEDEPATWPSKDYDVQTHGHCKGGTYTQETMCAPLLYCSNERDPKFKDAMERK